VSGVGHRRDDSVCGKSSGSKGSDVVIAGDPWPVLGEHTTTVEIALAEGDGAHAGAFEPEAKATDATEQIEDVKHAEGHSPDSKRTLAGENG
jgi:hypothetical protein